MEAKSGETTNWSRESTTVSILSSQDKCMVIVTETGINANVFVEFKALLFGRRFFERLSLDATKDMLQTWTLL